MGRKRRRRRYQELTPRPPASASSAPIAVVREEAAEPAAPPPLRERHLFRDYSHVLADLRWVGLVTAAIMAGLVVTSLFLR